MRGRPVRGFFGGFLLGICVDLDLAFSGAVKLNSVVLTIVPIALTVVGLLLGLWAPLGRSRGAPTPTAAAAPLPEPVPWPDTAPVEGSTAPGPAADPPADPTPPPPPI